MSIETRILDLTKQINTSEKWLLEKRYSYYKRQGLFSYIQNEEYRKELLNDLINSENKNVKQDINNLKKIRTELQKDLKMIVYLLQLIKIIPIDLIQCIRFYIKPSKAAARLQRILRPS